MNALFQLHTLKKKTKFENEREAKKTKTAFKFTKKQNYFTSKIQVQNTRNV